MTLIVYLNSLQVEGHKATPAEVKDKTANDSKIQAFPGKILN